MFPEPLGGLVVLAAGWALGKVDRWTDKVRSTDESTLVGIVKLTGMVEHLERTLARIDNSLDKLWSRHDDHEVRITILETHGSQQPQGPGAGSLGRARPGTPGREPDANPTR